jgi:cytochrome c oxidase accessory protein FixG
MDQPAIRERSVGPVLPAEDRVLSTLEKDGSRRWLKPRLSKGRFLSARRVVAYGLVGLYTGLPFVHVNGAPFVLFDVPARRFTIFGFTFLPTDTVLLALAMVGILLGIFMVTALLGRVWCGWACPQTVYMEFVVRPVERLFEGTRGRGGKPRHPPSSVRTVAKHGVYVLVCFVLANTFLAYFVGVKTLGQWMTQSPFEQPLPFTVMAFMTGLMLFDFTYFREQMCTLACPYGRLQSVLLDRNSLVVGYDTARGEPRGPVRKGQRPSLPVVGDCVDCKLCVQTCPTGIDIRDGLQMECVACAQCIDACDAVMHKLGRAPGLIRYGSQARDAGDRTRLLRARTVIYPLVLVAVVLLLASNLSSRRSFDAVLLRNAGQPFTMAEDGRVRNVLRVKVTSRTRETLHVEVALPDTESRPISLESERIVLEGDRSRTFPLTVFAPPRAFEAGQLQLNLEIRADDGSSRTLGFKLLGPSEHGGGR